MTTKTNIIQYHIESLKVRKEAALQAADFYETIESTYFKAGDAKSARRVRGYAAEEINRAAALESQIQTLTEEGSL